MFLNPAVKCFYCSTASTNHKQFININKSLLLSDLNCLIWWKMPKQVYSTGDWRFQRSNRRFAAISLSIDHPVAPHEHWTSINCVYVQIVAHEMGITHFYTKRIYARMIPLSFGSLTTCHMWLQYFYSLECQKDWSNNRICTFHGNIYSSFAFSAQMLNSIKRWKRIATLNCCSILYIGT